MQISSFVSLAALAVAGACAFATFQHAREQRNAVTTLRADLDAVRGTQMEVPTERVQVVYANAPAAPPPAASARGDAASPAPSPVAAAAPAPPPRLEAAQVADHVEAEFRSQPDDAAWSRGARQQLTDSLASLASTGARV
ncbi:MAG TPA: hypothetical protein VGI39_05155, partial [Polyangiaceae bacterium]